MGSGFFLCSVAWWLDRSGSLDGRLVRGRVGLLTDCYDDYYYHLYELAGRLAAGWLAGWPAGGRAGWLAGWPAGRLDGGKASKRLPLALFK